MNRDINVPTATLYRRLVNRLKRHHALSVLVKRLNIGRKFEVTRIFHKAALTRTDIVCDVGCGDGYWSDFFSRRAGYVIAFDPFAADLERAQRYSSKYLIFLNAVGEHIPLANSTVDKVISVCVFEHCYDDQQVFDEIFRILRSGGRLLATVDSLESPHIPRTHRQWHKQACCCHQLYTRGILAEKLQRAGFQTIETSYLMGSRPAVWWEIMSERLGSLVSLVGPILYPFVLWFERKDQTSGYKIFVEARK